MDRILFLTGERPFPPMGGGTIRDSSNLLALLRHAEVDVLCFAGAQRGDTEEPPLPKGLRIQPVKRDRSPIYRRALSPFLPYILNGFSRHMADALREHARPGRVLWVSRLGMAQYIPLAKKLGYRVILDEHNVESDLLIAMARSSPRFWSQLPKAYQCRYWECRYCAMSDAVVATSERDACLLNELRADVRAHVIPNTIDADRFASCRNAGGTTVFFSGTLDYEPNVEGLHWFVDQVMPLLAEDCAIRGKLVVAGARPSGALREKLESRGIQVVPSPRSMEPLMKEAALVIVPLLSGGGTRLKILEALASRKAVVSTAKGAEGLNVESGRHLLIADEPRDFAAAILQLMSDSSRRESLGKAGVELIERAYDWKTLEPGIQRILEAIR